MSDLGRRALTDAELAEYFEHSKNDHWIWVGSDIRILVGEIRALRAQVDALAKEWEKEADSPGDSDSIRHTLGACAHSLRRLLRDPEPADAGGEST